MTLFPEPSYLEEPTLILNTRIISKNHFPEKIEKKQTVIVKVKKIIIHAKKS